MPILTWAILSFNQGDTQLTAIFSATYSMQFFVRVILDIFVSGNLIKKSMSTGTDNEVSSGIVISTFISIALTIIMCINIDSFMTFMSFDKSYNTFAIYSISYLGLLVPIVQVIECKCFEEKVNEGFRISVGFNLLFMGSINILVCIVETELAIALSITLMAVYVLIIIKRHIKQFKFTVKVFSGCKYCYTAITNHSMMFVMFFFGMGAAFEYGPEFAIAISVMSMATDVQWDMCDSIFILSKTQISSGKANMQNLHSSSRAFVVCLISSSIAMAFILHSIYQINTTYMLTILIFEVLDMLSIQTRFVKQTWLDIEYGNKQLIIAAITIKAVRMAASLIIPSQYALWIGQVLSGVIGWAYYDYTYKRCNRLGLKRKADIER